MTIGRPYHILDLKRCFNRILGTARVHIMYVLFFVTLNRSQNVQKEPLYVKSQCQFVKLPKQLELQGTRRELGKNTVLRFCQCFDFDCVSLYTRTAACDS